MEEKFISGLLIIENSLCIDFDKHAIHEAGNSDTPVSLSDQTWRLLKFFCENNGQVLSKETLYSQVISDYAGASDSDDSTVKTAVSRLRNKIKEIINDADFNNRLISTRKGQGYIFMKLSSDNSKLFTSKQENLNDTFFKCPKEVSYFYGREKELLQIDETLRQKGYVYITGTSGIGKSEIAKRFVNVYGDNYSNVQFISYTRSLKESIAVLDFSLNSNNASDMEECFNMNMEVLNSWDSNSLIIVDNFNTLPENEPNLNDILSLRAKTIFTSTFEYPDSIQVKPFENSEDASNLFSKICPRYTSFSDSSKELLLHYFEKISYHTYTIILLGRLVQNSILPLDEILKGLEANLLKNNETTILTEKDGIYLSSTIYKHIVSLLDYIHTEINDDLHDFVYIFATFIPAQPISLELYSALCGENSLNRINLLRRYGIVNIDEHQLVSIHPIIKNILIEKFEPSFSNSWFFINSVSANLDTELTRLNFQELVNVIVELSCIIKCDTTQDVVNWCNTMNNWILTLNLNHRYYEAKLLCDTIGIYYKANEREGILALLYALSVSLTNVFNDKLEIAIDYINAIEDTVKDISNEEFPSEYQHEKHELLYKYYFVVGLYYLKTNYPAEGAAYLENARDNFLKLDKTPLSGFHIDSLLSQCYLGTGEHEKLDKLLAYIERYLCESGIDFLHGYFLKLYDMYGKRYAADGKIELASKYFSKSLQIINALNLSNDINYPYTLSSIAQSYLKCGDMVSALDYFNKALDWYKSSDDFEMFIPEIIELYCQLTYIYNKLNNREESQNAIDIAKTILDTYYKKDSYIYLKHLYILYRAVKTDEKSCELCLNYACKILSIYNTLDNAHKKTLPFSNLQVETDIFNFHHQLQDEEYISGNALDVFFKAIYCFDINETSLEIDKAYYLLSASTCITELINIGKTNEALLIYENGNRYVNSMNDSDKQLHEFEILNFTFSEFTLKKAINDTEGITASGNKYIKIYNKRLHNQQNQLFKEDMILLNFYIRINKAMSKL